MFSFCQLFRYKPVEEPGKRGGFLERLLTVVTSTLQVIIIIMMMMIMMVVVILILLIMVGLGAHFLHSVFVRDKYHDDGNLKTVDDDD